MEKTDAVVKTEAPKTRPVVLKEDGKEFHLAVSKTGEVVKYTAGAGIPDGHTEMTQPWDQDGALGGTNNGNGQGQGKAAADEDKDLELRTLAGGLKKEDLEALVKMATTLPSLLEGLTKSVTTQGEMLTKTVTRLDAVEKTAATAVKKAEGSVVHVAANVDSALENLGGGRRNVVKREMTRTAEQIRKAEYPESLWTNSLGVLETHIPGVEEV